MQLKFRVYCKFKKVNEENIELQQHNTSILSIHKKSHLRVLHERRTNDLGSIYCGLLKTVVPHLLFYPRNVAIT